MRSSTASDVVDQGHKSAPALAISSLARRSVKYPGRNKGVVNYGCRVVPRRERLSLRLRLLPGSDGVLATEIFRFAQLFTLLFGDGGGDYLARAEEISSPGASTPAATAHKKAA